MSNVIYKPEIIELFKKKSLYFSENDTHFIMRCPYCGDSRKRIETGHLYIRKDIPVFRCNRCSYGSSTARLIRDLTGFTLSLEKDILADHVDIEKIKALYHPSSIISSGYTQPVKLDYISISENYNDSKYRPKLNYLLKRFNTNRFIGDINIANKIVFDIKYIFDKNEKLYTNFVSKYKEDKAEYMMDVLERNFIGFIGYNNNSIIFRNIDEKSDWRYFKIKYNINQPDYFIIDRLLNVMEDIPNLVIAEGVFDILFPYLKLTEGNDPLRLSSRLYIAAGSKNYIGAIKYMAILKTIFKFNIYILADNDTKIKMYDNIYKFCKPLINRMEILTNLKDKDFGVLNIQPTISKRY